MTAAAAAAAAPTVADWIASREPAPPPALAARLRVALGAEGRAPASRAADGCLAAAERLARRVLDAGPAAERQRETALDLLCADALVTYAFEAAAADGGDELARLGDRAAAALARLAALAGGGAAPNGGDAGAA